MKALVLYSGAGGVCEGLRNAGITTWGIELNKDAAATARAAGHQVIEADVLDLDPWVVWPSPHLDLLQASPPCPSFSAAGKGAGTKQDRPVIIEALNRMRDGSTFNDEAFFVHERVVDERSYLTFDVARWIGKLLPNHVMLEQVPAVLPIWEAYAEWMRTLGYGVWVGYVNSEQFGVPQTRKRAFLLASHGKEVSPPVPTHSKYYPRTPYKLDPGVKKWVSMAEALGWGMTERPSCTVTGGGAETGGAEPFATGARARMRTEIANGRWVE